MDIESLSNYRPIYQLPLISTILERIVSKQLINYLNLSFDTRQIAYRKFHSPEILLLSILDDFINKHDNNSNIRIYVNIRIYIYTAVQYIILLDISAAFDTIDRSILIKRFEDIGISRYSYSSSFDYIVII